MVQPKNESVMIPTETKRRFVGVAKSKGLKVYAAAEQALLEWLAKNEPKKKGAV